MNLLMAKENEDQEAPQIERQKRQTGFKYRFLVYGLDCFSGPIGQPPGKSDTIKGQMGRMKVMICAMLEDIL